MGYRFPQIAPLFCSGQMTISYGPFLNALAWLQSCSHIPIHPAGPLLKILHGHTCAVAPFKAFPCCTSTPECIPCAVCSSPRPPSCISADAESMYSGLVGSRLDAVFPVQFRQLVALPGLLKLTYVALWEKPCAAWLG